MRFRITRLAPAVLLSVLMPFVAAVVPAGAATDDYKINFSNGDGAATRTTYTRPWDWEPGLGSHPIYASTNWNSDLAISIDTTECTLTRADLGPRNSLYLFATMDCAREFTGIVTVTVTGTAMSDPALTGSASLAITVTPVAEPPEPEDTRAVVSLKSAGGRVVKATVNEWGRRGPTVSGVLVAVQRSGPGDTWLRVVRAKTNTRGVLRVRVPGTAKEKVRAIVLAVPKGYALWRTPSAVVTVPRVG